MTPDSCSRPSRWVITALLALVLNSVHVNTIAAQPSGAQVDQVAERPWAAVWMSSLAKILAACDIVYEAVDRPELSDMLEERLQFREFQGIDRKRPLGMMWTWDDVKDPPAIIFIPAVPQQLDELMKTATFGVVDYHRVKDDQYEIERPGAPYHVLIRSGYGLFGEDVPALNALRDAPERLTRDLRDKYDLVFMLDQRQVPAESKQVWIDSIRNQFEPWLQQQDDEPVESAAVRRGLGKAVLDALERVIKDVQTVTIGGRLDPRTYRLQLDLILQAEPSTTMAAELNRLVIHESEFTALVNRDASAGLAINWPMTLLGKDLPALGTKGGRLDLGVQLIGADWSDMTLIAGVRGAEATALNGALPHLLARMEKSAEVTSVARDAVKYREVDIHRIVPARVPDLLQPIAPAEIEVLVGQGKQTVWLAAGRPETLVERLQAAIDVVEDTPAAERSGSVMQARMSVGRWPTVVPIVDPQDTQDELRNSKDGFSMSVQPVRNGLKIQFVAEEGLLRVIGRHWAKQVDRNASIQ